MVIISLDEKLLAGGVRLLKKLDEAGLVVDAALWFYFSSEQGWQLLLSLPEVITKGPKAAYQSIQDSMSQIPELPFSLADVVIAQPDSSLLKLLRTVVNTNSGITGIRFSNNVIDGQLIQDTYIYRLVSKRNHKQTPIKTG